MKEFKFFILCSVILTACGKPNLSKEFQHQKELKQTPELFTFSVEEKPKVMANLATLFNHILKVPFQTLKSGRETRLLFQLDSEPYEILIQCNDQNCALTSISKSPSSTLGKSINYFLETGIWEYMKKN
ncbi:MAG: hypothetical protein NZT61_01665 [Deltaproteobacteria bacterium]|nr:hypothetical protein [Deltaproteobacteria bacterium]